MAVHSERLRLSEPDSDNTSFILKRETIQSRRLVVLYENILYKGNVKIKYIH